jgi:putative transposase
MARRPWSNFESDIAEWVCGGHCQVCLWCVAVVGCGCYVAVECEYRVPVRVSRGAVSEVPAPCDRWAHEARLEEVIADVIAEKGAWLVELETMPDHVHLLVEVDPQFGIHRLVKAIKARSSRVLRDEFPWLRSRLPSLWTNSYFVATVGGAPLSLVKRYVKSQKAR